MKPLHIFINLLTILIVVGFPHLGLIPNFGYSVPILLLVWLVLRLQGERFSEIGFRPRSLSLKAVVVGALSAVAILSAMQLVVLPLLERLIQLNSNDIGVYDFATGNIFQLVFIIVMSWIIGGFYEEIVFHGFIFTRLEKMMPSKHATALSFVFTSLLFGAYHLQMGSLGTINALIVGAAYLTLFLLFKRNLWVSIICHGVYNSTVFLLIYHGHL